MMKGKFKFKTGTVAIYVLALMLVTVGYWNYISRESQTLETVANNEEQQNGEDENLGDAKLVSNNELIQEENEKNSTSENNEQENNNSNTILQSNENNETIESSSKENDGYFETSKLSRDTMYSQTLETYKEMLDNSNVSEEQKAVITQEITKLNKEKNAIMICENLITTKGFSNCVIFVNTDSVSVVIEADELKTEEIAQIQNIISREMGSEIENIHIMTR